MHKAINSSPTKFYMEKYDIIPLFKRIVLYGEDAFITIIQSYKFSETD